VTSTNTYLALFTGSMKTSRFAAWMAMPEAARKAKEQEGISAWGAWMQKHQDVIAFAGGPLGKTKLVSPAGISDTSNNLGGFVVVRADSHEAAAKLFENHPQFTIFPGEGVEIMPVMPIPGG
jgi:YCII-related domain